MEHFLEIALIAKKKPYPHGIQPVYPGICSADAFRADWIHLASLLPDSYA